MLSSAQAHADRTHVDAPIGIHTDPMHLCCSLFFQIVADGQNRGMLDCGNNQFVPLVPKLDSGKQRGIVGFGSAGGEDDFLFAFRAKERLHALPRFAHSTRDCCTEIMAGGCVAEVFREIRQHRRNDFRINPGRCIVVQIDWTHGCSHLMLRELYRPRRGGFCQRS